MRGVNPLREARSRELRARNATRISVEFYANLVAEAGLTSAESARKEAHEKLDDWLRARARLMQTELKNSEAAKEAR